MNSQELEDSLRQMNREQLIDFALSQFKIYNELLSAYEATSNLLMKSDFYLFEIIASLNVHLPEDNIQRKGIKKMLLKFFNDLHKNEAARLQNNLNVRKRKP